METYEPDSEFVFVSSKKTTILHVMDVFLLGLLIEKGLITLNSHLGDKGYFLPILRACRIT